MIMKKFMMMVVFSTLTICSAMLMLTSCTDAIGSMDNPVNPTPSDDGTIVGNWCSDVSGLTYAKWNYDKTW